MLEKQDSNGKIVLKHTQNIQPASEISPRDPDTTPSTAQHQADGVTPTQFDYQIVEQHQSIQQTKQFDVKEEIKADEQAVMMTTLPPEERSPVQMPHQQRASNITIDTANIVSSSSPHANQGEVLAGVAASIDLYMTRDKVRQFDSLGTGLGLHSISQMNPAMTEDNYDIISQSIQHSTDNNHLTNDADQINKQMEQMLPLETTQNYQTSLTQDKHIEIKDAAKKNSMNTNMFETSQKDIFESSAPVRQLGGISDATSNTIMQQTDSAAATSVSTSIDPVQAQNSTGILTKQEKLENHQEQQKKSFCSLFVIFGLNATKFVKENYKEVYEVIGSYPNLEQHPEVAADHKFVQDLKMICFPEINLKAERFKLSKMDPLCRCSFFHFIATSDMGDKKYLTSVHFKEILLSEKGAFVIEKAICVASSQPIFSLQKDLLNQVFHKVVLQNNNVSIKAFKEAQLQYDGFLDEFDQPPPHDYPNFVYKFMTDQVMCAENRRIRDRSSPGRSPSPRDLKAGQNVSNLPVVDFTSIMELYISILNKHLYYDPSVERDIHIIQTVEVSGATNNNYLTSNSNNNNMFGGNLNPNYTSQNTAAQSNDIQQKANKHKVLFKFRNMKPFGFQLENYQFDLLMQKLKPEKLIQLFTALLLERKIVLIKDDIGDIALIMQSLIALLNPFQWCFTIITYLTRELVDMLDAPFPFLIGVSTATWDNICTLKDFSEEIFIFDLESQERRFISKYELPELPKPQGDDLLAGLKDVIDKKDRRLAALKEENKQNSRFSKNKLEEQFDEQYWADAQLSVKQLFFNFLLVTVNDYTRFKDKDKQNAVIEPDSNGFQPNSDDFFDFQGYLEWQDERQIQTTGESNFFIREFVKTQCFHEFIEQNCFGKADQAENASVFFESCIELLNEENSLKKLKEAQQDMIDQVKYNLATPVKLKFNGILSKYVEGLRKREEHLRKCLDEIQPEEYKERKFSQMSEADQIDEIIMKYIFMRSEDPDKFRQYSLIQDINADMVLERIPRIRYDQVETYWQKMYKATTKGRGPIEQNPPHEMHVKKPVSMQKRTKKRDKHEIEYEQYINGNQASLQPDSIQLSVDDQYQTSQLKKFAQQMNAEQTNDVQYSQYSNPNNVIYENADSVTDYLLKNKQDLRSKKSLSSQHSFERQSQSTRHFASQSQQKVGGQQQQQQQQQRTTYNSISKKIQQAKVQTYKDQQLQQMRGNSKVQNDQFVKELALSPHGINKQQQNSSGSSHFRYTKSPKFQNNNNHNGSNTNAVLVPLLKSTKSTLSINQASNNGKISAGALRLNNSSRGGAFTTTNLNSQRSSVNTNIGVLSAVKSVRNKSQLHINMLGGHQQSQHHNHGGSGAKVVFSKKNTNLVQEKVRGAAARQRSSVQYIPTASFDCQAQESISISIQQQQQYFYNKNSKNNKPVKEPTRSNSERSELNGLQIIESHEIPPTGQRFNKDDTFLDEMVNATARAKQLPEIKSSCMLTNRQNPYKKSGSSSSKHSSFTRKNANKLASSQNQIIQLRTMVQQSSNENQSAENLVKTNKPQDRGYQSFHVKRNSKEDSSIATSNINRLKSKSNPRVSTITSKIVGLTPQTNKNIKFAGGKQQATPKNFSLDAQRIRKFQNQAYKGRKDAPAAISNKEDDVDADDLQRNIPIYTEKKAVKGVSGITKRNSGPNTNTIPVSKIQISYENPDSDNSFINIVKREGGDESPEIPQNSQQQHPQDDQIFTRQSDKSISLQPQEVNSDEKKEIQIQQHTSSKDNRYNSTENFREGVNEMIEDEANMTEKTAYYMQSSNSQFNKINSVEDMGSSSKTRSQMMPSNIINSSSGQQMKQIPLSFKKSTSWMATGNTPRQHCLPEGLLGSFSDAKDNVLMHSLGHQSQHQSNEKQHQKKSLPLSMLLSKHDSRTTKHNRDSKNEHSKTRSITEKQLSFQQIARMPSQSQVNLPQQSSMNPIVKQAHHGSIIVQPAATQLLQSQEEPEEEGWFTAGLSSKAATDSQAGTRQNKKTPIIASHETQQKLQRFYQDIDGSFMDQVYNPRRPKDIHQHEERSSFGLASKKSKQQIVDYQAQIQKIGAGHDSPQHSVSNPSQMSSRNSVTLTELVTPVSIPNPPEYTDQQLFQGLHPEQARINSTTTTENKILQESPIIKTAAAQQQLQQKEIDNSIAFPNGGILFSHQKRRSEFYRDEF